EFAAADPVTTNEDVAIALGLKAPKVTDGTDQSGSLTDDYDNPELLGVITLTGIPSGSVLQYAGQTFTVSGNVEIVLNDGSHTADVIAAASEADSTILVMSKADFE